jgi:hypothetical protein
MTAVVPSYKGFRYPVKVISHCVAVSPVPAELARRTASWSPTRPFGSGARNSGRPTQAGCAVAGHTQKDEWHLDEVFIKVHGKTHYLSHRSTAGP